MNVEYNQNKLFDTGYPFRTFREQCLVESNKHQLIQHYNNKNKL